MSLNRRQFLKTSAATAALAATAKLPLPSATVVSPSAAASRPASLRPGPKPNILYVILEDIGPSLACYGEPLVKTPVLDRFASQSIRFTNTFCTAPVCSASRSALMSGCYQIATGAHQHRTWPWNKRPLPPPARHLCDWFREAGYYTCNLQPSAGEKISGTAGARGCGKLDLNFTVTEPALGDPFDGRDWNQRAPGQPFFAHITINETHTGPGWKIARRQPKSELVDPAQIKLPPYYPDHPVARDDYANYLDAIHLADGYVAELLSRLDREGLADNTIVVISSDHGPLFRGKQFLYDNGLRIPLLVRFPDGRSAGTIDERLVSGVDIAPTLLGFAGIGLPPGATHGHDLFASDTPRRDHVFAARDRMDESTDRMRAVRTARFKYIRNYFPMIPYMQYNAYKERSYPTWNLVKQLAREGRLTPEAALFAADRKPVEELYDLAADPHEIQNLALAPAHIATLKQLRALVDDWVRDTNDHGAQGEDPLDIYRGYHGCLPGDPPPAKRPRYE
ncbi:sulfatase [Termitidicoccus mucosus]|uniref:Sulfatase N-terminal domain-containing protein n=1 Tax=Termitidicoccus mucosus TaxID=1184151 RepID=A0A178IK21_9BACT|nr:hypothetical protein AW736_09640 [Opitutaceae bacterium TSB47]